jgi:tetratricopeptide (TPR) repeat protein
MRVVRVSPILLSSLMLLGSYSASAQGVAEMGAVHAMSAGSASSVVNKANASALTRTYGAMDQMTSGNEKSGKASAAADDDDPDHYDPHVTVKKAGKYSNDLYTKGKAKEAAGKLLEAEQYYRQSVSYRERIWGMNDPAVQTLTEKIGDLAAKRNALPEAEKCYQRVLMSQIKKHGQGEFILTPILTKLGHTYVKEKKYTESINAFDQVYKLTERKNGASDATTVQAAVNLAKADINQPEYVGDGVDLMKMYTDLLDKGDAAANTPALLSVLDTYSEALEKSGKQELATTTKARADKVREAIEAAKPAEKTTEASADKSADKKADAKKPATKPVASKNAVKKPTAATTKKAVTTSASKSTTKTTTGSASSK